MRRSLLPLSVVAAVAAVAAGQPPAHRYAKKASRAETVTHNLAGVGLPTLAGPWYYAGPFPFGDGLFDAANPPDAGVDLAATYEGKGGARFGWKELPGFQLGEVYDLSKLFPGADRDAAVYLYHPFAAAGPAPYPVSLGSDDAISVWHNGRRLLHEDHRRGAAPDQDRVTLPLAAGTNGLLLKVGQYDGQWAVYVCPELGPAVPADVRRRFAADYPPAGRSAEDAHYPLATLPVPDGCVLEVGGLAVRPDGDLLACTRRGEVWRVHRPAADDPDAVRFTRFAAGLHEPLGLHVVDANTVLAAQRAEVTRLVDADADGTADDYQTVCDGWGVSGDYHEYAFGPAVGPDGHLYVTLNVGFGGGHQAKAAWRGWCVRIDPKTGGMEPWAAGLRSPNGVAFAPDGELFYADNQGEWVATNKLHHLPRGVFAGHPAGLKWAKASPFADRLPGRDPAGGVRYDADPPPHHPPAVWFPYGRMGQSASEPVWDTTGGKFGPFAGQCFVGDQARSVVMRVALEKVNGAYQGACFPFRSGLQCGVNRLVFGPDGSLYAGQTSRGWGSVGGRPYGLQRLRYSGAEPFEVHHVSVTRDGFDLTFTKPVDPASVGPKAASVSSLTYLYSSRYGSPEVDPKAEAVADAKLSADRRTVSLAVPNRKTGRVYEIRSTGVRSEGGEPVLHPEAYYTLNEVPK